VLAVSAADVVVLRPLAVESPEAALDDTPAVQAVLEVETQIRGRRNEGGQEKAGQDAAGRHVCVS
jgi:hypothetical protein